MSHMTFRFAFTSRCCLLTGKSSLFILVDARNLYLVLVLRSCSTFSVFFPSSAILSELFCCDRVYFFTNGMKKQCFKYYRSSLYVSSLASDLFPDVSFLLACVSVCLFVCFCFHMDSTGFFCLFLKSKMQPGVGRRSLPCSPKTAPFPWAQFSFIISLNFLVLLKHFVLYTHRCRARWVSFVLPVIFPSINFSSCCCFFLFFTLFCLVFSNPFMSLHRCPCLFPSFCF